MHTRTAVAHISGPRMGAALVVGPHSCAHRRCARMVSATSVVLPRSTRSVRGGSAAQSYRLCTCSALCVPGAHSYA